MEGMQQADEALVRRQTTPRRDHDYTMIGDHESSSEMKGHDNENEDEKYFDRNSSTTEYGRSESRYHFSTVSAMEFFKKAKTIRLKSHHDKYLTADPNEESVIQDRPGWSKSVEWTVEIVEGAENFIRFKSCYGKYLTASDMAFLLGMTGQKVVQTAPRELDSSVEWEPFMDGTKVKLKARYGNFLRANWGLPPWRNSVTHDIPYTHNDWIRWEVDIIETRPEEELGFASFRLPSSNFPSFGPSDGSPKISEGKDLSEPEKEPLIGTNSPVRPPYETLPPAHQANTNNGSETDTTQQLGNRPQVSTPGGPNSNGDDYKVDVGEEPRKSVVQNDVVPTGTKEHGETESGYHFSTVTAMEFFKKAKCVKLKSHHDKYLTADPDEESVIQDLTISSKSMEWTVEIVEGVENFIRLKSCYGKYLTASDVTFLLGMTGQKVVQTSPRELDSSVEWEPFMDGTKVKLKARHGNFLRANWGLPPWRNSITHDIPYTHHDWICWEVDVMEAGLEGDSGSKSIEILKSIVYGGLVESITSLSIVASAAASETATMNLVALGLANVISGVFVIAHNLRDMKNASPERDSNEQTDRYEELIGRKERFLLHFTFAILSFLLFGLIPPAVYGLAFKLTDNNEYTIIAVAAASLICVLLLSTGKAYCQGDKGFGEYLKTISYYVSNAVAVSGVAYGIGDGIKILVQKLGWFEPSTPTPATLFNSGATPFIASS
ncbi:unnamed protein product [Fraxinus pennsylvanica]|uniref:DUF569 domain-containing protein n=1 Tax=Fraxinus pennsylvanica TaxID=56036 RepID=A0AAD2DZ45_9LAMI|nr:unnamed protein product [Fraxinus pennsylvanica]